MKMYESQKRANKKWLAENYEQIAIKVPKGTKDRLKSYAAARGMSLTQYIIRACEEKAEKISK